MSVGTTTYMDRRHEFGGGSPCLADGRSVYDAFPEQDDGLPSNSPQTGRGVNASRLEVRAGVVLPTEPRWEANAAGSQLAPSMLGLAENHVSGGIPYREEVLDVRSVESYALVRWCVQGRDEGSWLYRGLAGMTKPPAAGCQFAEVVGCHSSGVTAASSSALCSSQFRTEPTFRPLISPELATRLSMIAPQVVLVQIDGPVDVFAGVAEVLGGRVRMEVGTVQQVVLATPGTLIECPEGSTF